MSGFTKSVAGTILLCLLAGSQVAQASIQQPSAKSAATSRLLEALIVQAYIKLNAGKTEEALAAFLNLTHNEGFADLTPRRRFDIYVCIAITYADLKNYELADTYLTHAVDIDPELRDDDYWDYRLWVSSHLDQPEVALNALIVLANNYPQVLKTYSFRFISRIIQTGEDLADDGGLHKQALLALWKANYKPNTFDSTDYMWFKLFELELADGNTAMASDIAKAFNQPSTLIRLRADKRYRAIADADPETFNYERMVEADLASLRANVTSSPRSLKALFRLAYALKDANRLTESLNLLDEALARQTASPKNKPEFDDADEYVEWCLNTRTRILALMGRHSDMIAAQIKARDVALARNEDSVSQTINLAYAYFDNGQPQEAIESLKALNPVSASTYGLMEAQSVRACAYIDLGNLSERDTSMAYLRAHGADNHDALNRALLCLGDLDAVAADLIQQLDNPLTRNATLVGLQTYLPVATTDVQKKLANRKKAVWARPDVQDAVARYGYIETWPTFGPDF